MRLKIPRILVQNRDLNFVQRELLNSMADLEHHNRDEPRAGSENDAGSSTLAVSSSPMAFLREAISAVPAVKYALGVGGIAAVIAIVAGFVDLRVALVGVPAVIVLMFILLIFSRLAGHAGAPLRLATAVLVWFAVTTMVAVTLVFALTFFVRIDVLHKWGLNSFYELFNITPSKSAQKRGAEQFIAEFDDAFGQVTEPKVVAQALNRVTAFWRQDQQRLFLLKWRCKKVTDDDFFKKSAAYVFENPQTLMGDIDTVARYFDTVSRCVNDENCDRKRTCDYFYTPMTDFRMQYADYFAQLAALEGRDSMANIRTFSFSCVAPKTSAPASELDCSSLPNTPDPS